MTEPLSAPFGGPRVAEIPFAQPPLVQVIAQVQFPVEPAIAVGATAFLDFHGAVKDLDYIYSELESRPAIGPPTLRDGANAVLWAYERRETSPEGGERTSWRVSLSPDFVAVYGPAYQRSEEYLAHLEVILSEVKIHFKPSLCERIGLRHVNRIGVGEPFETSATFVRSELHGFLDVELKPAQLRYSLTEAEFELPGDTWFHTKWGPVPQGTLVDPGIEAATGQHFLLDLDVFSVGDHSFDVEWIMERMRNYSQSSYQFFRWSLTDEGFALFGGKEYAH